MTPAARVIRPLVPLVAPALACLALLGGASLVGGCPGTTTPVPYTPFTGITIPASTIFRGYRCGDGPGEVYKYTAVVWFAAGDGGPAGAPLFSDVWDCFVDGVFENLPVGVGGNDRYFLSVFAYTQSGFPAALACPGGLGPNGSPCALQDASFAEQAGATAQWESTCTAIQQSGAPATAVCTPLVPADAGAPTGDAGDAGDAGVESGVGDDVGAAGDQGSAEAPPEASPDGSPEVSPEASADGSID